MQAIVGNYAIVTNQRGQFVGIVSTSAAKHTTEFWGKQATSTQKVASYTHGSYKSRNKLYRPVVEYCQRGEYKKWWGYDDNKNLVIIETSIPITANKTIIPGEFEDFIEVPWINIIIDDDELL